MKYNYLVLIIMVFTSVMVTKDSLASNCVNIGDGPIQRCYNPNGSNRIARPFIDNKQRRFVWVGKEKSYCFRNKYGNYRCMQKWEVDNLQCTKQSNGSLFCE